MTKRSTYRLLRSNNLLLLKANVSSSGYEPITIRLLIDTGSSFTTLPLKVLEDIGCNVSNSSERVAIMAAGGMISAPIIAVPSFNCLGQQVKNFPVVAVNLPFNSLMSGLLGMDFLVRYGAVIDVKKAEITL